MMRSWCWLLISALAGAAQAAPPTRVEIASQIVRNGSPVAEVVYRLWHDARAYELTESWKGRGLLALTGSATRTSRGIVSAEGLKPLEFTDERTGRRTARAKFDWNAKTVTLHYRGDPRTEPMPAHAHDRLAFLFTFAFAPPSPGAKLTFDLLDGRGQSHHVYAVDGRATLKIPAGEFNALKLVRPDTDELVEIWLAPELSYLPVRVLVVNKDGTRYDQVATKISAE
ncbi:MAG: DUF3108 domain-containing protein [Betaproteobacteria bacterium]|nr:MAG: DUF3108 domain-containing protein [Betaproteobacteria bacterium]